MIWQIKKLYSNILKIKPFKIDLLLELIQDEISNNDILLITNIDLTDDQHLNKLLSKHKGYYEVIRDKIDKRNSLILLLTYRQYQNKLRKELQKALIYPAILFVLSMSIVFAFITMIYPRFNSLFASLTIENSFSITPLVILFNINLMFLFIIIVFFGLIRFYKFKMYCRLIEIKSNNIWVQIESYKFAYFFNLMYSKGYNINEILMFTKSFSDRILLELAQIIRKGLDEGHTFESSIKMLDMRLISLFKKTTFSFKDSDFLKQYIKIQDIIISQQINRIGKGILYLVYIEIGFIVYYLYQLMMIPLSIMEKL